MLELSIYRQNNLLYTQEPLSKYRLGGYHPVTLGDTFKDGRYKTHHKLGWGGFSTVWLAFDKDESQWVALKIMKADSPEDPRELHNLKLLEGYASEGLSAKYVVQLLDEFSHQGPNGIHQCLVFELLGPSVADVFNYYIESAACAGKQNQDGFHPLTILRLSKQLLEAVRFIHHAGMCHGDISGSNIAFSCSDLSNVPEEEIMEVLGDPIIEQVVRIDGKPLEIGLPTQLVEAATWIGWADEDYEDIRLLDFGESFLQGEEPERLAQPGDLRVPETIFTESFDYRLDLWRAGCAIFLFVFTGYPFFYFGKDDSLIFQMTQFAEKLPPEWQSKWEGMRESSKCERKGLEDRGPYQLEASFAEGVHDKRLEPLLPIIRGLMRFLPSNRITADEALDLLGDIEEWPEEEEEAEDEEDAEAEETE